MTKRSPIAAGWKTAALRLAAVVALSAWLGLASPAGAGEITIEYDLAGSTLTLLSGTVQVPPDGGFHSASAVVEVAGSGPATPAGGGAALLRSIALDLSIDADVFGNLVTGAAAGMQVGSVPGTLSAGLLQLVLEQPIRLNLDAFADCSGDLCSVIADFPISFSGTQTLAPVPSLGIGGLQTPGNATLAGTLDLTVAAFTAQLALVGVEVNRTYVPEPAPFGLLGASLAALAAVRSARARRARSSPRGR